MALLSLSLFVVLTAVVTGPLVGGVTLQTEETGDFDPGTGSIEMEVLDTPETVTLRKGQYGSEVYYLEVPDARISVQSITGQPIVVYKIRIEALGSVRITTHFFDAGSTNRTRLSMERVEMSPARITSDEYTGELIILTRGEEEAVLHRSNVTVVVQ